MTADLLVGLLKIIFINIILSGDNAVVIALACRNLPATQQKKAVFWGSFGAVGLRIVLTFVAVWLLQVPFLQAVGSLLLLYIAVKLLKNEDESDSVQSSSSLAGAIKTVIIADFVMSLDNVIAVAGAAEGNYWLIGAGLALSIPLIIWGSQLLMRLMHRFPIIVVLGAALLGYTAGEMVLSEKAVANLIDNVFPLGHYVIPIALALIVVVLGRIINRRAGRATFDNGNVSEVHEG